MAAAREVSLYNMRSEMSLINRKVGGLLRRGCGKGGQSPAGAWFPEASHAHTPERATNRGPSIPGVHTCGPVFGQTGLARGERAGWEGVNQRCRGGGKGGVFFLANDLLGPGVRGWRRRHQGADTWRGG